MLSILFWLFIGLLNFLFAFGPSRNEWWFLSLAAGIASVYFLTEAIEDYRWERHYV